MPRWLELSAGFVAAQVNRSRHYGLVISRDRFECLDAFPYRPRVSLHANDVPYRLPQRWKDRIRHAQLAPLLGAYRIELVHAHFGHQVNDLIGMIGRRPLLLSLHGHDVTGLLHDQPQHYDRVVGAVDAVTVPSRFLAAAALKAGFAEDLIRVLPSGVDTSFFTPTPLPSGPPLVAFVGRLVAKKGLDVLLAAWPQVQVEVPEARLHVLGSGELAALLDETDDSVVAVQPDPSRRHDQVRELMQRASLVVAPSRTAPNGDSESLLLVNLEAGASGRPVVSTQHGGIPEYVKDDHSGLLVPEGDADALAQAIIRVLKDESLARRLATGGIEQAKIWDVNACAALMDDLYDELLARPRK
ncbi:MAG TPA: glycosyltransferase [Mycobacteriales bacterium]|nr:glycosyltransferase [Mycobacteriales bacterium]